MDAIDLATIFQKLSGSYKEAAEKSSKEIAPSLRELARIFKRMAKEILDKVEKDNKEIMKQIEELKKQMK
jgi:predicted transcriptional regulator